MNRILITGANRGIGLELTRQLLARGEFVFAGCRQPAAAADLQALAATYPDHLSVVALDVTDDDMVQAAAVAVTAQTAQLDWLINNAGVLMRGESLDEFDPQVMTRTLDINVTGAMRVSAHFVDLLRRGTNPRLLNISSQLGSVQRVQTNRLYSYNASKAALNMVTRMLAHDLAEDGVAVFAVHPGWVQTDMGGSHAAVTVPDSAAGIIRLADTLTAADSSRFVNYLGEELPW